MIRSFICAVAALALGCGCRAREAPVQLTSQKLSLADEAEYTALFDDCLDTLRRYGFDLDRVDRRAGLITTFPMTSQQFFEFWRHDVDTPHDWVEASLTTIRRRVEVQAPPPAAGAEGALVVSVLRERFSAPDRQYNSSGAAFLVYSQALPATTGRPIVPSRDVHWIADGRDAAMEERLLREMTGGVSGEG